MAEIGGSGAEAQRRALANYLYRMPWPLVGVVVPGGDRNQEGERPGLHWSRVLPYQVLPVGSPQAEEKM